MYSWIWEKLPGSWPIKLAEAIVALAVVVVVLFVAVFPAVEPNLPFNNVTVDEGVTTPDVSSSTAPVPTSPTSATPSGAGSPVPTLVEEGGAPGSADLTGDQGGSTEIPVGPATVTPAPLPS